MLGFTLAGPARADDAQQQPCTPSDHTPPCGGPETSLSGIGGQQLVGGPGADTSYPELTGDDDSTPASDADRHWVESPYAPHDTTGANLRLGSAVGRLIHDDHRYTALGVTVAGGPRMGRFTLEGHYTYLQLSAPGPSEQVFGSAHRVGLMGRADLVRLDSHIVGANALLAFYGEAGMMHELHRWLKPGVYERREVSRDGGRTGAVVGFGFNLDLRLEQPRGFPNRIGWQLGWQMTASDEHDPDPTMICKGVSCLMQTTATHGPTRDTSMLVTSTIAFTW
ncbi:MAG TPA: hypothetical protein VHE35_07010 [Kofleriaceae bacterium]|nr:hypothetical protein [Kofleriaceae bacterium]